MAFIKKAILHILQFFFPCKQLPVPANPGSILVVRQHDQLGDLLMSTAFFRELKKTLPNCHVSIVVTPYTKPGAESNPHIDEVITYERRAFKWTCSGLAKFIKEIRKAFDMAIVLNTPSRSVTSDLIAFFSGARFRLGMEPRQEEDPVKYDFLYHATSPRPHPRINQCLENLTALAPLGIIAQDASEEMFLAPDELRWAKERLRAEGIDKRPIVMLPGVGYKDRQWPVRHFVELGNSVSVFAPILVLWGPGQERIGETVLKNLADNAKTVRNTSIRQMAALIAESKLTICGDTGGLHMSAALKVPTIGLYGGATNPKIHRPPGDHVYSLASPSGKMRDIKPGEVQALATKIISKSEQQDDS